MQSNKEMQLGKKGLTKEFIDGLKKQFENAKNIRVKVLKSSCRDKSELEEIKEKILEKLGQNYKARTIGYTIMLKKQKSNKKAFSSNRLC